MITHIKILCIFAVLVVKSYATQNIILNKSGTELFPFSGFDYENRTCNLNMRKICGIYKITCIKTNKVYIGQSGDCKKREWYYSTLRCKGQQLIYNSIKKYGWSSHKFEIIHECAEQDRDKLEIFYEELYQSFDGKYGLNLRKAGRANWECTEKTKQKLRDKLKGRISPNKGKKFSDEWKKNLSLAKKGKKIPYNQREKMIRSLRERWAKLKKPYYPQQIKKPVNQYSLDGFFIRSYESAVETEIYGFKKKNVSQCCLGQKKTHKNFKWAFKNNVALILYNGQW
jgi:group I intron endonuclease